MPITEAPNTAFAAYTAGSVLIVAGFLAWWYFSGERSRGPALPLLLLGGACAAILEPFVDNVILFYWPPEQDLAAFKAFGRTVPVLVIVTYAWFCGGLPYLVARFFERGVTKAQVWLLVLAGVVIDFFAVGMTTWLDLSGFYGDPPLNIAGYPLWWGATDVMLIMAGGTVVYFLMPWLEGAKRLWLLLVPTIVFGASIGGVLGPVTTAINSQWSDLGKLLAALLTIAFSLALFHLIANLVAVDGSVRRSGRGPFDRPGGTAGDGRPSAPEPESSRAEPSMR